MSAPGREEAIQEQTRPAQADSRGDRVAESRITASALAHRLLCSRDLFLLAARLVPSFGDWLP